MQYGLSTPVAKSRANNETIKLILQLSIASYNDVTHMLGVHDQLYILSYI